MSRSMFRKALLASVFVSVAASAQAQSTFGYFTPGDLVISTVSDQVTGTAAQSVNGGGNGLDTASPITLTEFSLGAGGKTASSVGTDVLPQSGSNPISGEYGSASEGVLQLSGNGAYLTIAGYGVSANAFNSAINNGTATATYGTTALGQTTSLTGQTVTTVPRAIALIGSDGYSNTTTQLTGVFNTNNPRSVVTADGTSFYVSGQGVTGDSTGGVFYTTLGATTATPINVGSTTPSGSNNGTQNPLLGTETRSVEIYNGTLYVSRDFGASGQPNDATDIRSLTNSSGGLPTSATGLIATRITNTNGSSGDGGNTQAAANFAGPPTYTNYYGSLNLGTSGGSTSNLTNGVNNHAVGTLNKAGKSRVGKFVYLSPEQFWFANSTTLYVADSGQPKNGSADGAAEGEGGLQKWTFVGGVWVLDYDIFLGLDLVNNDEANSATDTGAGVTGLFGLTGIVVGNQVELFATSYGLNELSPSFLYEVTDSLSNTSSTQAETATSGQNDYFNTLYSAPVGVNIRGVSFAPVPEPISLSLFGVGLAAAGVLRRRRK